MRVWFALIALFIIPLAAADLYTGWHYAGDTFEREGIVYSVEGSDERSVLLGVAGKLMLIQLYDCREEGLATYCYVSSAYPDDETHVKYDAGHKYYGYQISIETLKPEVKVEHVVETGTAELGENIEVTGTVTNTGEQIISNILFEVAIPEGLKRVSGQTVGSIITLSQKTLRTDNEAKIVYVVQPTTFGKFTLKPTVTYEFNGQRYNVTVAERTIEVATPIEVETFATEKITLDTYGTYRANITNIEEEKDVSIVASIPLPAGVKLRTDPKGLSVAANGTLTAAFTLGPDEERQISFEYSGVTDGTHTIPLQLSVSNGLSEALTTYNEATLVDAQTLTPTIQLSTSKGYYLSGTQLTATAMLENKNDGPSFSKINGKMASSLFKDVPFVRANVYAKEKATERVAFVVPEVEKETSYLITFNGSYVTSGGRTLEFAQTQTIVARPRTESVVITHTMNPAVPVRGKNVTVTVTAKNTKGQYLTMDASEQLPEGIVAAGGLLYTTVSLNKDESKQLYIYVVRIPDSYELTTFTPKTIVRVKGELDPEQYVGESTLSPEGAPEESTAEEQEQPSTDETTDAAQGPQEEEELGFFSSIWHFLKGLFD